MKINSFEMIENNNKENESKFTVSLEERLAKDAQKFIDGGEITEEYRLWAEIHNNVEFHILLDNDITPLFAKKLYKIFDSKFHPKVDPGMVFVWSISIVDGDEKETSLETKN